MTKRAFGLFLSIAGACALGAGCSSSSTPTGTGGTTGTGGRAGAGGAGGAGGVAGTGGAAGAGAVDAGTGGRADAGAAGGSGGRVDGGSDAAVDAPADAPSGDASVAPTFTQVFMQVLNNTTLPTPATSPGCANCHDGMPVDGGNANQMISHSISYLDKAAAYTALVGTAIPAAGVDSLRCGASDAGAAIKRVLPGNPDESVLVQKLRQGLGIGTACDKVGMPLNIPLAGDGGAGSDAGFTQHQITQAQLDLVVGWVTAGAKND